MRNAYAHHERDCNCPGNEIAHAHPSQKPERHQSQDAHIHSRDHQHVVGAGALEVGPGGAVDECVFADHHGVHQRGFARRPQSVDFLDDAAMDSGAPEFSPAAGKTGKHLDAAVLGRGQSDDSVVCKVTLVVKRARIAVVAWRRNPGGKTKALPILKQAHGGSACLLLNRPFRLRLIDTDPQAGVDREILVTPGDLLGLDLDPLAGAAGAVLLQTSFFGDVGSDHDLRPVGEVRPAGIARIIRAAYLNHESA